MRCTYPNCRAEAVYSPVVQIPTVQELTDGGFRAMDQPTYLIGHAICDAHRNNYNLMDWIRPADWNILREAAKDKGFKLPEQAMAVIKFMPVGWMPNQGYVEVER